MLELGVDGDGRSLPSIEHLTVAQATQDLAKGTYTSVDLVRCYLKRIDEVNEELRPVLEVNHRALDDAAAVDAARAAGRHLGPLAGLPVLIKGNMATIRESDKDMQTHAGSFALLDSVPSGDCTIVSRLKAAGAIILGKTNLSQWANYRSDNSSSGWSSVGGQTLGAYHPRQEPGGSSSGSGVAADLALALLTIGTETCGSISSPTAANGIVGIKPTIGLTSRFNCVPLSSTADTIGPMCRTVADAAALLSVIAGKDERDAATSTIPLEHIPDYVKACRTDALRGARIGVPWGHIAANAKHVRPAERAIFDAALTTFRSLGATIVHADWPDPEAFLKLKAYSSNIVSQSDFVVDIAEYFGRLEKNPQGIKSLEDLQRFTQSNDRECYPDRDTARWDRALDPSTPVKGSAEYKKLLDANVYAGSHATILGALEATRCEALVVPSNLGALAASFWGSPTLTVVAGARPADSIVEMNERGDLVDRAPGIPVAISLLGRRFSEETLIGFAYAFEQATQARKGLKHAEGVKVPTTQLRAT